MGMDTNDIENHAKQLAHTVIMSFQDEKRTQSWLKNNRNYSCKKDRVIHKAVFMIRTTLQDRDFSLSEYKQTHS